MPRPAGQKHDKFQRYRAARKAAGLKLVRVWIPDPRADGFGQEAERQAVLLRGAADEQDCVAPAAVTCAHRFVPTVARMPCAPPRAQDRPTKKPKPEPGSGGGLAPPSEILGAEPLALSAR